MNLTGNPLELWGGVECTVNRVGNDWFDQLRRSGHDRRELDLDQFAALGLRRLRYPFLWERAVQSAGERPDWNWAAQRIRRLSDLQIQVIAGLVHHGSGPSGTSLADPDFPDLLARYAGQFAARFPEIRDYTPVNEPLTTARFSGLYGHWYPHAHSASDFLRMLIHQCRAVVLAMRRIREIQPAARLVQTEDLGRTFSTPPVARQAEFDNERRWLSLDLLCGKVDQRHGLWKWLIRQKIPPADLLWFQDNPCPPDLLGINHYVLSNRFLDHRTHLYPPELIGGNGRQQYADIGAVRVEDSPCCPVGDLLLEAWDRYKIPMAITEAHLDCTREEQLRWLLEIWNEAGRAKRAGADVRAVTVWGLLGLHDWRSLLTRDTGDYEPGVFDVSSGSPRPTLLAHAVRSLANSGSFWHPILQIPGWWRRSIRVLHPHPVTTAITRKSRKPPLADGAGPPHAPVLIAAGNGRLGEAYARVCELRGLPYRLLDARQLNPANPAEVARTLVDLQPWAVIHAAGYLRGTETHRTLQRRLQENEIASPGLARQCARRNIPFLTFSPDLVFDGQSSTPYHEESPLNPLNEFGRRIALAEKKALHREGRTLLIRTGTLFGPWDNESFLTYFLNRLRQGRTPFIPDDQLLSLTYIPDLVNMSLDLLLDGGSGIWHLANEGPTRQLEFVRRAAKAVGLRTRDGILSPVRPRIPSILSPLPGYRVLGTRKGALLPPLEDAGARYLRDASGTAGCARSITL